MDPELQITLIILLALAGGILWLVWVIVRKCARWLARLSRPRPSAPSSALSAEFSLERVPWSLFVGRSDVLIVDTETTGVGTRSEVIEVAVLDTTGELRLHALSMPQSRIPRAASAIHGLTRARLRDAGAVPWPEIQADVEAVLSQGAMLIGWNAAFDKRLLHQTAERHGLQFPSSLPWYDLLSDYRELRPGGRHRLVDAVKREGIDGKHDAHRAVGDCRAVLAVLLAVSANRSQGQSGVASGARGG